MQDNMVLTKKESSITKKMDKSLEKRIRDIVTPIQITDKALAKANKISRRVHEMCMDLKLPSYEMAFYLLSDRGNQVKPTISDVYVAENQHVFSDHCEISGAGDISSLRNIRNMNKVVVGHGHSHAVLHNFYSDRDALTFDQFLADNRRFGDADYFREVSVPLDIVHLDESTHLKIGNRKPVYISLEFLDNFKQEYLKSQEITAKKERNTKFEYIYGMVFNAKNDDPFTTINVRVDNEIYRLDRIGYDVVETEDEIDEDIDKDILERVAQIRNPYNRKSAKLESELIKAEDHVLRLKEHLDHNIPLNIGLVYSNLKEIEDQYPSNSILSRSGKIKAIDSYRRDIAERIRENTIYLRAQMGEANDKVNKTMFSRREKHYNELIMKCRYLFDFVDKFGGKDDKCQ